jgi:hypothetical protein
MKDATGLWGAAGMVGFVLLLCLLTGCFPGKTRITRRRDAPILYWLGIGGLGFVLFLFAGAALWVSLGVHL